MTKMGGGAGLVSVGFEEGCTVSVMVLGENEREEAVVVEGN